MRLIEGLYTRQQTSDAPLTVDIMRWIFADIGALTHSAILSHSFLTRCIDSAVLPRESDDVCWRVLEPPDIWV